MQAREAKRMLALMWIAAASVGVLLAAVPLVDEDPPARLLAVLLVAASLSFGLLRPAIPVLWAVVIAWPTVMIRLSQVGWSSVLLFIYTVVGVYVGDWLATWWREKHPKPAGRAGADAPGAGPTAADGTAVAEDGLPPVVPSRWERGSGGSSGGAGAPRP